MKRLTPFFLLFSVLLTPLSSLSAQTEVKPDIRGSIILVKKRLMPSKTCFPGHMQTPEEWIAGYVGYNKITQNQIKFYSDLVPDGEQMKNSMDLLLPYTMKTNSNKPFEGTQLNRPAMNARICAYQAGKLIEPPPSPEIIYADGNIPYGTNLQFWDWGIFAAIVAKAHIPLKNGKYDMKKPDVIPDAENPLSCNESPPGALQEDTLDPNEGLNPFTSHWWDDIILNFACGAMNEYCQCEETTMYIKPDTTCPWCSYTACNSAGCKNEQGVQPEVEGIADKHEADDNAKDSGGAVNAYAPGILKIFEYVAKVFGSPMGIVDKQSTTNNQGERINPLSWSFTKDWEISRDFLICKISPLNTREKYGQFYCNTNWLANMIGGIKNKLQGSTGEPDTLNAEPVEEATSSIVPAGL
jgi:hypothetical protein